MARDKTDKTDETPVATPATTATRAAQDGDGLTWQRETVAEDELSRLERSFAVIETDAQMDAALRLNNMDYFWPKITALADECDEILQENGFPPAGRTVRHDGAGNWWLHPTDAPKLPPTGETWNFTNGAALAQASRDFSDPWYAGRIGLQCRLALEHNAKGDAGKPFLFAMIFQIATLRADWKWRRGNKPSILTGRKQRKALSALRETQNRAAKGEAARRRMLVADLMQETRLTGGALDAWLVRQLAERHGIEASLRTIRADRAAIRG